MSAMRCAITPFTPPSSLSVISGATGELPQRLRMNTVWFLAAWTLLSLLLCWIWLHHSSMTVCRCCSLMKTAMETWRGARGRPECTVVLLTQEGLLLIKDLWPRTKHNKMSYIIAGKPLRSHYADLLQCLQSFHLSSKRSKPVIKPHDKHTTHWACW